MRADVSVGFFRFCTEIARTEFERILVAAGESGFVEESEVAMNTIDEPDWRKPLLPGQGTVSDALSKALEKLIAEGIKAMEERDREYEAWRRSKDER